ncbi:MAG: site-specific DNA-methyltransferase [Coriobacteriia bacterium]|nr:site-specific DNA-methyltransferase [Coriobacteriia bacterium]
MEPYYSDDWVTLYLSDFREVLPTLRDASVDLVLCDPPYGHNNNSGDLAHHREAALGIRATTEDDARPIDNDGPEANGLYREMLVHAKRLLKPGCCCCCCCCGGGPDPQFARWSLWMDELIGFKQAVVWDKGGLGMGWHYRRSYEMVLVGEKPGAACHWFGGSDVSNVVRVNGIKPQKHDHPTPKPVPLMARFVEWHSEPGDLVVDPFCGSGPVARACKDKGRRCIGMDTDERWLEMAARRCGQEVLL